MTVKLNLHPYLVHLADNKDRHEVNGATIGECLEDIVRRYPDLEEWLFTEERELKSLFDVFLNMESTEPERLAKPVRDGDDINIIIVIAGG